jgi:amidase
MGRSVPAAAYLRAWDWLFRNAREVALLWEDHDLLLTPTLAEPPVPLGTFASTRSAPIMAIFRAATFAPFTPPFNVTGQPAISLPLQRNAAGLPIGIQLVGGYGREDLLIRIAAQLEAATPFDFPRIRGPLPATP